MQHRNRDNRTIYQRFKTGDASPVLNAIKKKIVDYDGSVYVNLFNSGVVVDVKKTAIAGIEYFLRLFEDRKEGGSNT